MKQKLAIVGGLLLNKEIIIMDQIFNGVDMISVKKLYSIFEKIKRTKHIILSSHIIETLINTCDKIVYLNNGKIEMVFNKEEFDDLVYKLRTYIIT